MFQNQQEQQYFRLFADQIAPHLAGSFQTDLWDCLVLQACEREKSILHAIIAVAALESTSKSFQGKSVKGVQDSTATKEHHQFALQQYQKAIRSMRKATLNGTQDLRTTLITCLIIICFETYSGNHETAIKQAMIGLDLVEGHLAEESHGSQVGSVEEEIFQAFSRLDIQAMSFLDCRPPKQHAGLTDVCQPKMDSMPAKFTSLQEARKYLYFVMQRLMHFMGSLLPEGCNKTGSLNLDVFLCVPDELIERKKAHLAELKRWRGMFDVLLVSTHIDSNDDTRLGITTLELQYITGVFSITVLRAPSELYPNMLKLMPFFEKIVFFSESILQQTENKANFMFEMHTICPLYAVAWRCPQRKLRRKAISLILGRPRREGLWDSALVGKLGQWIMQLEEENFEGEYAPDHLRCSAVDVLDFNMVARTARVRCFMPGEGESALRERTTVITWDQGFSPYQG